MAMGRRILEEKKWRELKSGDGRHELPDQKEPSGKGYFWFCTVDDADQRHWHVRTAEDICHV